METKVIKSDGHVAHYAMRGVPKKSDPKTTLHESPHLFIISLDVAEQ